MFQAPKRAKLIGHHKYSETWLLELQGFVKMAIVLKQRLTPCNVLTKATIQLAGPNFHTPF